MKCPRCSSDLNKKENEAGITVDFCVQCQGIWLAQHSLRQVLQTGKTDLPSSSSGFWDQISNWKESDSNCPDDVKHLRTFLHRGVEVDMCPECSGLWLDKGEWEKLDTPRNSASVSVPGVAAIAIGGAALLGATAMLGNSGNLNPNRSVVTGNEGQGVLGSIGDGITETAASGILDGAFSLAGDFFSALDIF